MRKIFCIVLSALILLSFAACGKEKDKKTEAHSVDVEYYAKLGQIPECKYALGADIDDMNEELDEIMRNSTDEYTYDTFENDGRIYVDYAGARYYYDKDNKEDGVTGIVYFNSAYDFPMGTVTTEIKSALSSYECTVRETDREELFFMPMDGDFICYDYKFGENNLTFVFYDNAFCAIMLYGKDFE